MAYGIENFPNITASNADYPKGSIKDDTGANDGTPVNKLVYDDVHQTNMKVLLLAGITANNLPDNVTNGYQYVQALQKLFKNYIGIAGNSVSTAFTVSDINKLIITGGSGSPVNTLPSGSTLQDADTITFLNVGSGTFTILEAAGDSIANNPGVFAPNDYVRLVYSKSLSIWFVVDYRQTITPPAGPKKVLAKYATPTSIGAGSGIALKFPTVVSDVNNQFNTSTGALVLDRLGSHLINVSIAVNVVAAIGHNIFLGLYNVTTGLSEPLFAAVPQYAGNGNLQSMNFSGLFEVTNITHVYNITLTQLSGSTMTVVGSLSVNYVGQ